MGHAHALESVLDVLVDKQIPEWGPDLVAMLTFDTLIANSDRHHDNWGILRRIDYVDAEGTQYATPYRLAPAFDNGTSLGSERLEEKMDECLTRQWLQNHACGAKATHHMRIRASDEKRAGGLELLGHLLELNPSLHDVV